MQRACVCVSLPLPLLLLLLGTSQSLTAVRDEMGLDCVTTFNEFAVPLVARLAERLGLPGVCKV